MSKHTIYDAFMQTFGVFCLAASSLWLLLLANTRIEDQANYGEILWAWAVRFLLCLGSVGAMWAAGQFAGVL